MTRGLPRRSTATKLLASAAVVGGALALTFGGAFATLTATANGTSTITSGTLLLKLVPDGSSSGLPETISNMAPGDVYNVYVDLENTGTLASASGMTLAASASPANALTNGSISGEGLSVAITMCSQHWTETTGTPGSATCSGSTTPVLSSTSLSSFSTPQSLSAIPALAATNGVAYLQFQLTLNGNETSTNGTLPSATIQGLTTTITWTFTETQRAGVTTNA
ncbi:MAG: TasA family protein [Acidimicrobiales bacterium]